MRKILSSALFIFSTFLAFFNASAQDSIVLVNGKVINGRIVEIRENKIKYSCGSNQKKIHSIDPERVFAITKSDGTEQIIFRPDTIDEPDFTVSQLRMFIKGEQAAQAGYHNTLNKGAAFAVGTVSSFFSIYGLVGPALYSSIVGSTSPDITKQPSADPNLINVTEYREGYLKITRDKKIRNSYIAGMIGFTVGFITQSIIGNNTKR